MRVIAGTYRGRTLRGPESDGVRPTTDRVRESLFNILANRVDWDGARVCDLFAGSGSLGIEALSRGAEHATFVDTGRQSIAVLRRNLEDLALLPQASVQQRTVVSFLNDCVDCFRVIFADPPYAYADHAALLDLIARRSILEADGLLCIEHAPTTSVVPAEGWDVATSRSFGTTMITLLSLTHRESASAADARARRPVNSHV